MRLTIIVPDSVAAVNGEFRKLNLTGLDPTIHAVQWDGAVGHIEFNDGKANQIINNIDSFAQVVSAWDALTPPAPLPPTLSELKADKSKQINLLRDAEESAGFSYLNKVFDSDPLSVQRISIAAQTAQLDPNFVIGWTAQDNTVVSLNQSQMLGMPAALAMHAYTLHEKARQLKAQVAAATSSADLDLINW